MDRLMRISVEVRIMGALAVAAAIEMERMTMIDFALIEAPVELQPMMLALSMIFATIAAWWIGGYAYQEHLKRKGLTAKEEPYSKQHLAADVLGAAGGIVAGVFAPGVVIQAVDIVNAGALGWGILAVVCAAVGAVICDYILHFGVERFFTNIKKIADDVEAGVGTLVDSERKRSERLIHRIGIEGGRAKSAIISVLTLRRNRRNGLRGQVPPVYILVMQLTPFTPPSLSLPPHSEGWKSHGQRGLFANF